ncbi:MAG: motA, chemotaxis [Rickettsiales bacterium]|jgi:chemotaxis protein MotA|nr:motA, chemotaxis [Rickettsiales bacterium]
MLFIIGFIIVIGSVGVGYGAHGGNMMVLWQPLEFLIIVGAAIGAFIIGNPAYLAKATLKSFKKLFKGTPHKKKDYVELLMFLYNMLKLIRTKGMLQIEGDIENPHESEQFKAYPVVLHHHELLEIFCDTIRLMTMGVDDHYQIEETLEQQMDAHHHDLAQISASVTTMADGMPALGIVAAVLGVITTMGSITEPPEVLGHLIGAALVGTFLGVLLSYGIVGPIGNFIGKFGEEEGHFLQCLKIALVQHAKGAAPVVSVEFARKAIPEHLRPSFKELEDAMNAPKEAAA